MLYQEEIVYQEIEQHISFVTLGAQMLGCLNSMKECMDPALSIMLLILITLG